MSDTGLPRGGGAVVENEKVEQAPVTDAGDAESSRQQPNATRRAAASRKNKARLAPLYRAYRSGRPMEGRVERLIKGGYEIKLGKARAFCPGTQMNLVSVTEPAELVGQSMLFRVTQLRRGGEDVVVSHRAVLEEERREEAKAVRATLIEGSVMQGHVSGIASFGAFVDLGAGVRGLVHLSELSHSRVASAEQAVQVGQRVDVRVLKIDEESGRISLSLRRAVDDPWDDVEQRFRVGETYPGTVCRLADFGAFVELAPGVEALAPASEFAPSTEGWRTDLDAGVSREWLVLSVDRKQRRIAVTLPAEDWDPTAAEPLSPGISLTGRVQRVESFGVFIWLAPGKVGLMPNALSGTRPGTDLSRRYAVADAIEVDVVEIAEDGKRIRLAKKGVRDERKAKPKAKPEPVPAPPDPEGAFGTLLADKLKAALDPSRDRS